ncbi:hypothetical protein FA15DRAFT_754593 [Coprinopsis marcescibilis]|uniref:Uncharacterized protein n=1 Tax=Coprinopsis marcescibilis TaxID=230819 RepID=A0A5C3L301_COPMA|nr:hypothetical protein FA15DRAFT_754593 [Coprinopsis marcescibilis]
MPGRAIANALASQTRRRTVTSLAATTDSIWLAPRNSTAPTPLTDARPSSNSATSSSTYVTPKSTAQKLPHYANFSGSPAEVWNAYISLMNSAGYQKLPLEIHQEVLRKCTPPGQAMRVADIGQLAKGDFPIGTHANEGRLQVVIRNIRASGHIPTLDDYNYVLSQFAAVGYFLGSRHVYRELLRMGRIPSPKTIGLCFQALAHRLTLPMYKKERDPLTDQARRWFSDLLADMRRLDIPLTSVNMDLAFRILKENLDMESLEGLIRWAYGIDLSYPDKPPLEMLEQPEILNEAKTTGLPLPFSTASLNTTLDVLGRMGNISKMVQAFEVLTQPLPHAQDHFFSSFEEDEEDAGAISNPSPTYNPPSATPNTTTYITLLRHVCQADHATFARHYLNEAMDLEKQINSRMQTRLRYHVLFLKNSDKEVLARHFESPSFSLNRGLVMPILGQANRDKNLGLMRWLSSKMPKIIKRKKTDLDFYVGIRKRAREIAREEVEAVEEDIIIPRRQHKSPLELDVDSSAPPAPATRKPLDLNLHIQILRRDVEELTQFSDHLRDLLGRTTQRVKERLGRRVWEGKDIYLSEVDRREVVSKDDWKTAVGFRPRPRESKLPGNEEKSAQTWTEVRYQKTMGRWRMGGRRFYSTSFAGLVGPSQLSNPPPAPS